jgi:CheY-like chemotaxis protein
MLALVVDDDTLMRLVACRILRRAGIATIGFATADAALALLDPPEPAVSLVVTDVHMPGVLDGIELARRVGATGLGPPVIVMSGSEGALDAAARIPGVRAALRKDALLARLGAAAVEAVAAAREARPWQADDPRR